jgi:hypothetical protein
MSTDVTMKLCVGSQRVLRGIERDLAESDPPLTAFFSSFTLLAQDEEMPRTEKIMAWPLRMLSRMRGRAEPREGRRSALWRIFYGPLALVTVMCGGLYYKPGRVYSSR